ncbi:DUF3830 family protein [Microvirga puerhi]|uniref:DUF3830 family protein n=1 Tax=Microvirga puerhi TaxID=2876078 RepID=A0ABS7VKQ7_9HYPH|nr:DUF3830 family protein [Microvirga puerhi]MBZ6075715.1 DUF3830 family protein [Microvirga puerhi]
MERRLHFKIGDVTGSAILYDDVAPKNIAVLWNALPILGPLRHARWSGQQVYMKIDPLARLCEAVENPVSIVSRGQVVFRPERGMFSVCYGRAQQRDQPLHHRVVNGYGSLIGYVDDNTDALLAAFAETDFRGSIPIEINR